eukprot:18736-Heterococcus_DN1.PRE.9
MRWLDTRSNIARTLACCTLACCSFAHLSCPYTCTLLTSSSATHSKRCVRSLLLAIIPLQCAILDTNAAKSLAVGDKVLARHPTSLWRLYPGTDVSPYDAKTCVLSCCCCYNATHTCAACSAAALRSLLLSST